MNKYNILIVHNYYKLPGGEANVVDNEINMLKQHDHNVFLYSRDNNEIDSYSIVKKILLPINYLFNIKTYFDIKKIIKENRIDIIHVHNTIHLISKSVYYAAIKCNIPIVQTIHNYRLLCPNAVFFYNNEICENCLTSNLYHAVKKKCYRNSYFETLLTVINIKLMRNSNIFQKMNFICLTEFNKNKLMKLNLITGKELIKEKQVYIKPNLVISNVDKIVTERENYFIFSSRLEEGKGIKFLLEVWKNIKDTDLIICGDGYLYDWCKEYIKNNNIDNIVLKGNVDHKDLRGLISKAKCLVFPSRWYESFGMTIIEAYSVGTPVLAPDFGNSANLVINGVTGYKYKYDDKQDFVSVYHKILYSNLFESSFNEFKSKYSEDINYEILLSIYNDCISRSEK